MHRSLLFSVALIAGSSPSWAAGAEHVFPLDLAGTERAVDGLRYTSAHDRIRELAMLDQATLTAVMLPDGRMVDLELTRIRNERMRFRYYVDGVERGDLLNGLDLSIWKGTVRGIEESEVRLSFSHVGTQGWIRVGSELVHATPRPDENGDWWNGDVLLVTEEALNARGMRLNSVCATPPPVQGRTPIVPSTANGAAQQSQFAPGCALRECKISIETDFQYYQKFNNLSAQTTYTTTLWSYISDRYETQASTLLTFPYLAFYTTAADPWSTPEQAGQTGIDQGDLLNEFRNAWLGNIPNGGRLGHFMSGAGLGGGVAYLNALCNSNIAFGVSANFNGTINFPIVQQPNNWDFIVDAHEVGHNFNALHTHDYCPPLDECAPNYTSTGGPNYWGQCQTQTVCSNQGTIMSYCHLCSGGTANIVPSFHATSAADMTQAALTCLPEYDGLAGSAPSVLTAGAATPVTAMVSGTPTTSIQLKWRANSSQSYSTINMTSQGSGNYAASLPAFACGDTPQFYYAFTEQTCGLITFPDGAPTTVLSASVLQPVFQDNFQSDLGWTPSVIGATSGGWQRGVPVNDSSWAYDPLSDSDGSGSCWLTENVLGNTDVDNGSVRLQSPQLDLTGGPLIVNYSYFLNLTNANGNDALVAEISANGTSGPWVEIARHNQNKGLAWTAHSIASSAITGAGVTLGNNMRIRFTANDGGTQSIVEAGLDGFLVARTTCSGVGVNYCTSTTNSSGSIAVVTATGSNSISANNLVLHAAPVPASINGLFFFGATQSQTTFGNGIKCVASPTVRLPLGTSTAGGQLDGPVNNAVPPASAYLAAGTTWNFQAWFRDAAAGGSNYNLSDGYRITFQP